MKHKKGQASSSPAAVWIPLIIIAVLVVFIGVFLVASKSKGGVTITQQTAAGGVAVTPTTPVVSTGCNENPAYTYKAIDVFSASTNIGGTDYIKDNANIPVTSLPNPTEGHTLQYWKDNQTTAICELKDAGTVVCGSSNIQTKCYRNSTVTLAVVNTAGAGTSLTDGGGANKLTLAANGVANLRIDYTGTAKRPFMPLGGCLAVEYPTNVSSISLSGSGISSSTACPYTWTYSPSTNLSNTYATFAVPKGFDVDGKGDQKSITFQMQAGSNGVGFGQMARVRFQPTAYYLTNDGNIVLGIEKDQNQDTTKTYGSGTEFSFQFG